MKPLYILKIGGSVATDKSQSGFSVRKKLLKKIAFSIRKEMEKGKFDLILIHGAGAAGHQLAKKYALKEGVNNNKKKFEGSLLSRITNQNLNTAILDIFISAGLPAVSCNTASVIIQKNKKIFKCNLEIVRESLKQKCIPLLFGEMVFDVELGMSICSGDSIASYLADKLGAKKIFFASDVDGIFTRDPHIHRDSELLEEIFLNDIRKKAKVGISHNVDVTDGLLGKLKKIGTIKNKTLESIEIFNGFQEGNYQKVLSGKRFKHTSVFIK